jgi:S1-C subfamily serine protease
MRWTELDFLPAPPKAFGGGGAAGSSGLDTISGLMQIFGAFFKVKNDVVPRGLLGVELAGDGDRVTVIQVLGGSPAARAGVRAGDRLTRYAGKKVDSLAGLWKAAAELKRGDAIKLTVLRDGKEREMTVTAGEGL